MTQKEEPGFGPQKFDTFLEKFRFLHPGLLMNSRTYLTFQVQSKKRL